MAIDTPTRLLRLLVLFSSRSTWSAQELTDRLAVTPRTLRRDVTRLRDLGYPIESTTGRYGGYALGAGGRLPPLLLDDDEAVAVSVALRELSRSADPTLGEPAVAAMTKLLQVLPSALRERVDTLGEVTVRLGRPPSLDPADTASTDVTTLMTLAQACRREDRLRFDYRAGDDRMSRRHVEPHRLVSLRSRWYLVAFDLDRDDWRTFRVDRIGTPVATGARSTPRPAPDAAALVAEGVAVRVYDTQARVRVPVPPAIAAREIPPTVGVIERSTRGATSATVQIGGDPDWIARYLASLPFPFEVLEPEEVRREVRLLAQRLLGEPADQRAEGRAPVFVSPISPAAAATVTQEAVDRVVGGVRSVQDTEAASADDRRMDNHGHPEPRIGIGLPAAIPALSDGVLVEWARRAESAGFSSLGVIDRLVYDNDDPFVALAAAAAATERPQLVTTVLNVLWRQSALALAKQLWSLDRLSAGRLVAGLGMGGWPDDYTVTGTELSGRGARFDVMVQEMQRAWAGQIVGAGGPLPALPAGRPAVLFGGLAPQSFERAARSGQGWVAPLFGFDLLSAGVASIQRAWSEAGRAGTPRILTGRYFSLGVDADATADEYIRHYYGEQFFAAARADTITTEDGLASELQRLRDAGCHDVVLYPCSAELDQIERLASALDSLGPWRSGPDERLQH